MAVGRGVEPEFAEDPSGAGFYGLLADVQRGRDRAVGAALGDGGRGSPSTVGVAMRRSHRPCPALRDVRAVVCRGREVDLTS